MCYKSPGPRCTTHAVMRLEVATTAYEDAKRTYELRRDELHNANKRVSEAEISELRQKLAESRRLGELRDQAAERLRLAEEKKLKAREAFKQAREDYRSSPEGIKKFREAGNENAANHYEAIRSAKIDALRAQEEREKQVDEQVNRPVMTSKLLEARTEQAMRDLGGRAWEKGGHRRVYFNLDTAFEMAGGEIRRYQTGNISRATLPDGSELSNTRASRLDNVYYDVKTKEWHMTGNDDVDSRLKPIFDATIAEATQGGLSDITKSKVARYREYRKNPDSYDKRETESLLRNSVHRVDTPESVLMEVAAMDLGRNSPTHEIIATHPATTARVLEQFKDPDSSGFLTALGNPICPASLFEAATKGKRHTQRTAINSKFCPTSVLETLANLDDDHRASVVPDAKRALKDRAA
jgi:hypothetical protein